MRTNVNNNEAKHGAKRVFVFVCAVLMMIAASFSLLACKKPENEGGGDEPKTPSLSLNQTSLSLTAGETYQLAATLENSDASVVWSTADGGVATVSGGLVTAVAKGVTSVTATAGELSASCAVTVSDNAAPVLELDWLELNIIKGRSFTVHATTTWNGAPESPDYSWQTESDKISLSADGASCTVNALAAGEAEIVVSATVRGVPASRTITVNVLPIDVGFDIANITPDRGRYELALTAEDTLTPETTVTVDGVVDDDATIAWSVTEGTGVVSVDPESGLITALIAGNATVTGSYTADSGETASVRIYVTVRGIQRNLSAQVFDFNYSVSGETLTGTNSFDITLLDSSLAATDITSVELDGEEIDTDGADITVSGTTLTLPATVLTNVYGEDHEIVIYFKKYEYRIPATFVSKTVTDQTDFFSIGEIAAKLGGNGYYAINNNITLTEAVLTTRWVNGSGHVLDIDHRIGADTPFIGTLDGKGNSVTGLIARGATYGWIQNLGAGGTLKNIAFLNTTVNYQSTLVRQGTGGTVKDVFVELTAFGDASYHSKLFGFAAISGATFSNVVVDFGAVSTAMDVYNVNHYTQAAFGVISGCAVENVAVVGLNKKWENNVVNVNGGTSGLRNGLADGLYVIYSDGSTNGADIPEQFSSEVLTLIGNKPFDFGTTQIEKAAGVASEYSVSGASAYWHYTFNSAATTQGITYGNGKVTIPATAAAGNYTLTATSILGGERKTLSLKLLSSVITSLAKQTAELGLSVANSALQAKSGNLTLDLTVDGVSDLGTLSSVTFGSTEITGATLSGNTLTIPYSSLATVYGDQKAAVTTRKDDTLYTFTFDAMIVSLEATTKDQFLSFGAISNLLEGGGYFTLGGDITLTEPIAKGKWNSTENKNEIDTSKDYRICTDTNKPFIGTIDGQRHSVSNMRISDKPLDLGWIQNIGANGTIKNIAFKNATIDGKNVLIRNGKDGKVQDVFVELAKFGDASFHSNVFGYNALSNTAFDNVVVDFSAASTGMDGYNLSNNSQAAFGIAANDCTFGKVAIIGLNAKWKNNVINTINYGTDGKFTDGSARGIYVSYTDETTNGVAVPTGWSNEILALLPADRTFEFANASEVIAAGTEYAVPNVSIYYDYKLSSEATAQNITFAGGKIIVPDDAAVGNYTFTATPIFGGTVQTLTIIVTAKLADQTVNLKMKVNGDALVSEGEDLTVDLGTNAGTLQRVTVGGTPITGVELTGGGTTLTIPCSSFGTMWGEKDVSVVTEQSGENRYFGFKLLIVSVEARDVAQFRTFGAVSEKLGGGGYFTLGTNITLPASSYIAYAAWSGSANTIAPATDYRIGFNTPFIGTIDGQGYSVSGMQVSNKEMKTAWIKMDDGSVLKNIAFTNFKAKVQNALVLGTTATIQNVFIQVSEFDGQDDSSLFGVANNTCKGFTLSSVVADYSTANVTATPSKAAYHKVFGSFAATSDFERVAVTGVSDNWKNYVVDIGWNSNNGKNKGIYASYADGTDNGVTFPTGWNDTYWTVSGNSVTWKTKS